MARNPYRYRKNAGEKERCVYCGSTGRLEVDHRLAISRGGADTPDNLQVVCHTCNSMKGARTPGEFEDYLSRRHGGIHDGKFAERRDKLRQDKFVDQLVFGVS